MEILSWVLIIAIPLGVAIALFRADWNLSSTPKSTRDSSLIVIERKFRMLNSMITPYAPTPDIRKTFLEATQNKFKKFGAGYDASLNVDVNCATGWLFTTFTIKASGETTRVRGMIDALSWNARSAWGGST